MDGALKKLKNVFRGKTVAVAVSGGRDSMALLHLFEQTNFDFFVINVEHGIRGEQSCLDTEFVRKYCQDKKIKFQTVSVDSVAHSKAKKVSLEQAARELRYHLFNRLIDLKQCDVIVLAHHQDDNAETILMRILRGTGLRGLCGIETVRDEFIRPLLPFSRKEIENYIKKYAIPFVDDCTNFTPDTNRNFLRLEVIPLLKQRYPSFEKALFRLSRNAEEAEQFVFAFVRPPERVNKKAYRINEPFLHDAVLKREILLAARCLGVCQDIEEAHLNMAVDLKKKTSSKSVDLKHNLVAMRESSSILIALDDKIEQLCILFSDKVTSVDGNLYSYKIERCFELPSKIDCSKGELYFDGDKVPSGAVVRYRKEGDRLQKFGGGTKSLGDFFTDKKISAYERDRLPVLAVDNDVLIVFGVEISKKVKVDENSKNIYKISRGDYGIRQGNKQDTFEK